jgi:hypothetical protein
MKQNAVTNGYLNGPLVGRQLTDHPGEGGMGNGRASGGTRFADYPRRGAPRRHPREFRLRVLLLARTAKPRSLAAD